MMKSDAKRRKEWIDIAKGYLRSGKYDNAAIAVKHAISLGGPLTPLERGDINVVVDERSYYENYECYDR